MEGGDYSLCYTNTQRQTFPVRGLNSLKITIMMLITLSLNHIDNLLTMIPAYTCHLCSFHDRVV